MTIIRNLARNPSAETGTSGWEAVGGTLSQYFAAEQWPHRQGNYMFQAASAGSSSIIYLRPLSDSAYRTPVGAGQWVAARVWAAHDNSVSGGMTFLLAFYDAAGGMLSNHNTGYSHTNFYEGAWRQLVMQAPAGAASYRVELRMYSGSSSPVQTGLRGWCDGLSHSVHDTEASARMAVASGYHDGDTLGWAWDGIPHASTSRGPARPYTPEGRVRAADGAHVLWLDVIDGFDAASASGTRVQVARHVSGATSLHVSRSDAGPRTGRMVVNFVRELAEGTPGARSAALEAQLRAGAPLTIDYLADVGGLAGRTLVPTGDVVRRLELATVQRRQEAVWTVEFDYTEVPA